MVTSFSALEETRRILGLIRGMVPLPEDVNVILDRVRFVADHDFPHFPIPFKESETASALKAIEASLGCALQDLKDGTSSRARTVTISFEKATAFLFQAYLCRVGGYQKMDAEVKRYLLDTDLHQAQSNPYRRMSANLYQTKQPDRYYHLHGSLEASATLRMIGLEPFRADLTAHEDIVQTIESHVQQYTVAELEALNATHRQAGVPAFKHGDFLQTPHGKSNADLPPWDVVNLEHDTAPRPLPVTEATDRPLAGIRVLELCRIIAGPAVGRILAEYGADVLKITSPRLSDVPFFQVDGNMGKHAAHVDLTTPEGRQQFEALVCDADVVLDGYRPGALAKLGCCDGDFLRQVARSRGYGMVYVSETCFGYEGEWAGRPGWQQIADCVTGVAWEQGRFMGLDEPVVPPFPMSDYGTGCIGAIAALTGLYLRATVGGSWHGRASLIHYDLLLFHAGLYPTDVQDALRASMGPELAQMCHSNSVDQISSAALATMARHYAYLWDDVHILETWRAAKYGTDIVVVQPVAEIAGVRLGFQRASRPNGSDDATWHFGSAAGDFKHAARCERSRTSF